MAGSGTLFAEESEAPDPGLDDTVFSSRVKLTNEYIESDFDIGKNTTKLGLAYAFGEGERLDWTVQVDLPLVAYFAGNQPGAPDATGFGDIEMRVGHVADGDGLFRWGYGLETRLDTAAEPQLGDGVFRLSPIVALAVQPSQAFKFQTNFQFDQSLASDSGVAEQQAVKVKPALFFNLPASCYLYLENELTWDLSKDAEFHSKMKFEVGRGFGDHWILSARYEVPLTPHSEQQTFTLGCTYTFR
jgi:hypothetical protein